MRNYKRNDDVCEVVYERRVTDQELHQWMWENEGPNLDEDYSGIDYKDDLVK